MDKNKIYSITALLLLVPAPSVGVIAGMILWPGPAGKTVFITAKIWLLAIPVIWHKLIEGKKLSLSKSIHGGHLAAAVWGIMMSLFIIAAYILIGKNLIDAEKVTIAAEKAGLTSRWIYIAGAGWWITANSLMEEYVWRWFVTEKFKILFPATAAILLSAVCFTIHHILAMSVYFRPWVITAAAAGIFAAAVVWGYFYQRYKSIWPGYVCHLIVDLPVFGIGYYLIFLKGAL